MFLSCKKLNGFSGADIYLATNDNKYWFVRKVAKSPQDSARLILQADKQILFSDNKTSFKIPKIINSGFIDDKYYFDMDYIKGPDAIKYLSSANYEQVNSFSDKICNYILEISKEKTNDNIDNLLEIKNKIINIHNSTKFINKNIIDNLIKKIEKLEPIPTMLCHGDFTLENMIVGRDGSIYLLDFLNSNFNHYWQDVSKLYQDLSGGWFLRKNISISKCVTDFLSKKIYDFVTDINPNYKQIHYVLICYNFLRILPYAQNTEDKELIKSRLIYFGDKL